MWTNDQNKHEMVKSRRKRGRKCVINVLLTIKIVNSLVVKGSNWGKKKIKQGEVIMILSHWLNSAAQASKANAHFCFQMMDTVNYNASKYYGKCQNCFSYS